MRVSSVRFRTHTSARLFGQLCKDLPALCRSETFSFVANRANSSLHAHLVPVPKALSIEKPLVKWAELRNRFLIPSESGLGVILMIKNETFA